MVPNKIQIGAKITNGLGAGSDPAIGRQAALEDTERIFELLEGADLVFVTAGLGGGTGAGAAPVVATLAKELDALTVAIVTKPFSFRRRRANAAGRTQRRRPGLVGGHSDHHSQRSAARTRPAGTSFFEAFRMADDILRQAVQGISDIILTPGLINLDFSDIKATMLGMGYAMIGTAVARARTRRSKRRARPSTPRCSKTPIKGARGS